MVAYGRCCAEITQDRSALAPQSLLFRLFPFGLGPRLAREHKLAELVANHRRRHLDPLVFSTTVYEEGPPNHAERDERTALADDRLAVIRRQLKDLHKKVDLLLGSVGETAKDKFEEAMVSLENDNFR